VIFEKFRENPHRRAVEKIKREPESTLSRNELSFLLIFTHSNHFTNPKDLFHRNTAKKLRVAGGDRIVVLRPEGVETYVERGRKRRL
jgi:hypothetical protein